MEVSIYLKLVQGGKPVVQLMPIAASALDAEQENIRRILSLPWIRPGDSGKFRGAKSPNSLCHTAWCRWVGA